MPSQSQQPRPLPEKTPHRDKLEEAGVSTFSALLSQGYTGGRPFTDVQGIGPSRAQEITAFLKGWLEENVKEAAVSVHDSGEKLWIEKAGEGAGQAPQEGAEGAEAPQGSTAPPEEGSADTAPQRPPQPDEPDTDAPSPTPEPDDPEEYRAKPQNPVESDVDLSRLQDFFPPEEIEWRPDQVFGFSGFADRQSNNYRKGKALALAYVTNRAIQNRLDEVVGPTRWRNEYKPGPNGGVVCGLSLYLRMPDGSFQWVTKWDGAENSNFSPVKGGLSDSMKRAGYQWGIGRYLYRLPTMRLQCEVYDANKNSKGKPKARFDSWTEEPELPPNFLPEQETKRRTDHPQRRRAEKEFHASGHEFFGDAWEEKRGWVIRTYAKTNGFAAESTNDLTVQDLRTLSSRMKRKLEQRKQDSQQPQQGQPQQGQSQQGQPQQGNQGAFEGDMGNWNRYR